MTFELDATTAAAPDTVLEAVRREAAYWQESLIPPALRRLGVLGVKAQIDGTQFELAIEDLGRDPPPTSFVLRGRVTGLAAGGCQVRAWPSAPRGGWFTAAIGVGLTIWLALSGSLIFAGLLLVGICTFAARVPTPAPGDAAMQHLVDRLSLALQALERRSSDRVI